MEATITVNGREQRVPAGCTVKQLVELLALDPQRVAVEKNREVVPRRTWPDAAIVDGDRVEVVTFVGGG